MPQRLASYRLGSAELAATGGPDVEPALQEFLSEALLSHLSDYLQHLLEKHREQRELHPLCLQNGAAAPKFAKAGSLRQRAGSPCSPECRAAAGSFTSWRR